MAQPRPAWDPCVTPQSGVPLEDLLFDAVQADSPEAIRVCFFGLNANMNRFVYVSRLA